VKMLYKYGGSILSTMNNSNRHVRMYQSDKLEFVVNQSIWLEGEGEVRRRDLPGLHQFRAGSTSAMGGAGGYGHHGQQQLNHRVIILQSKAIERSASRSPTSGSSTRSASGSASPTISPKAATRSTG